MELNNYSDAVSNVVNMNNNVLNAQNLLNVAREKIKDQFGDILTAEGSRELLGKVLTPLTKRALNKIGISGEDVDDIANGNIRKAVLRKIHQKLGIQTKDEADNEIAQRVDEPVINRGGLDVDFSDALPGVNIEQPLRNIQDINPFSGISSDSKALLDNLGDPESFENYARSTFPDFSDAPSDLIEQSRGQINTIAGLDLEQPLGDIAETMAPGYRVLRDVNNPESAVGENLSSVAETDLNPLSLQTPRTLGGSIVNRVSAQVPGEIHQDNILGAAKDLVDEEGGSIKDLAKIAGSSSGSGDASLSAGIKSAVSSAGEDAGLEDLSSGLLGAAEGTAEIPVVGEALAPLLALGAGLTTLFVHKHSTPAPILNPSYQFL